MIRDTEIPKRKNPESDNEPENVAEFALQWRLLQGGPCGHGIDYVRITSSVFVFGTHTMVNSYNVMYTKSSPRPHGPACSIFAS